MSAKQKIGVCIVTYNRQSFFESCIQSVAKVNGIDCLAVVNDGTPYPVSSYIPAAHVIQHRENLGVGVSKNDGFRFLLKEGCTDFFIIEDDIVLKDPNVLLRYIELKNISGIQHFSYALHGPANKVNKQPAPRLNVNYSPEIGIALYRHCVGAFCYYSREVLERVGLMNEVFFNGWEHCEQTYRIYKAGYTTPFWWNADLNDSWKYIDEQACSEVNSVIRSRDDWRDCIFKGIELFKQESGYYPMEIPDTPQSKVIEFLRDIRPK